jgi:hypothetical protein
MRFAQSCQHGEAVHSGKVNVEHDQVRRITQGSLQTFSAVIACARVVIRALQFPCDLSRQSTVVFDYENTHAVPTLIWIFKKRSGMPANSQGLW